MFDLFPDVHKAMQLAQIAGLVKGTTSATTAPSLRFFCVKAACVTARRLLGRQERLLVKVMATYGHLVMRQILQHNNGHQNHFKWLVVEQPQAGKY